LFRGLKPAFPYFRFSSFLLLFVSALNSTVLTQLTFKLLSYLASFMLQFAYVAWKLPYKKHRENALALVVGLGKGGMVVALLALQEDAAPLIVIATSALLAGAGFVWWRNCRHVDSRWMQQRKLAKQQAAANGKVGLNEMGEEEAGRPEAEMTVRASDAVYARLVQ